MRKIRCVAGILLAWWLCLSLCRGEDLLFEDTFDTSLSTKWEAVGLAKDDYRIRNGGLEVRVQRSERKGKAPMLMVNLPFKTSETVTASVEVTVVDQPLGRHEFAGMCLLDGDGPSFTVRKQNVDGYFVLAPGEVDFIGKDGEEGDPGKYTLKYWPADKAAGPLRIIVNHHYAHFQTGPTAEGKYQTFFHSAIQESDEGMGFGLVTSGGQDDTERWVRFDNFRVWRN
jgi:hypothetical protein